MTIGGEGITGIEWSSEQREKKSLFMKEYWTDDKKSERSEKIKGENNPNYGNKWSNKQKEIASEKFKDKYSNENNPMYGKKHTEEAKEKNRISNSGKNHIFSKCVICITTKKIFYSIREASRYYNVPHSNISKCCKKDGYKTAGKLSDGTPLKWAYIEVVQL